MSLKTSMCRSITYPSSILRSPAGELQVPWCQVTLLSEDRLNSLFWGPAQGREYRCCERYKLRESAAAEDPVGQVEDPHDAYLDRTSLVHRR